MDLEKMLPKTIPAVKAKAVEMAWARKKSSDNRLTTPTTTTIINSRAKKLRIS
jgi:hypothetical protein